MNSTRQLSSFYEAAERLGVSYFTIWRAAERGDVRSVFIGSRRFLPVSELERVEQYGIGSGRKRRGRKHQHAETVAAR
jgi:excisionase family DNA binding protein